MPCNFFQYSAFIYTDRRFRTKLKYLKAFGSALGIAGPGKGDKMRYLRYLALLGIFMFPAAYSQAQVAVGIGVGPVYGAVGPAPVCAYGYYGYAPYACAPYGYYGPGWFAGGIFIGAGPWYHGYYGRGYGFYGRGYGYYGRPGYGYYGRGYYRPSGYGYYRGGGVGYAHGGGFGGYARGSVGGGFHGGGHR
jgi:hypothetical protein